jgi:uncharacterized membrane protein
MVRVLLSWHDAGMSRCAGLVLSYSTFQEMFASVVETVVFVVLTVCGEEPLTGFVWSTIAVPVQSLLLYAWKRTLPARLPPCGALIVAESFGMND